LLLGAARRIESRFRLVRLAYAAGGPARARGVALDTYQGLAGSVAARCEELGLGPGLVLAESFGGGLALQLALDHPQRVGGLLIVNSFARYPAPLRLWFARLFAPLVPRPVFDLVRRRCAPQALFGSHREAAAIADFRALSGTFFDHAYRRRLAMIASLDLFPRLCELRQPTSLVAGDADRIVPSVRCMTEMSEHLCDATLEIVPGGGHLLLPLASQPWEERLERLLGRMAASGR